MKTKLIVRQTTTKTGQAIFLVYGVCLPPNPNSPIVPNQGDKIWTGELEISEMTSFTQTFTQVTELGDRPALELDTVPKLS